MDGLKVGPLGDARITGIFVPSQFISNVAG
jgi:hypothetical protein